MAKIPRPTVAGSSYSNPDNKPEAFLKLFKGNHLFNTNNSKDDKPPHHTTSLSKALTNNLNGHNVFFTVNELDQSLDTELNANGFPRKRTRKMLTSIRASFADDDSYRTKPRNDWPIPPTMIVRSSYDPTTQLSKFHYYWIYKEPIVCSFSNRADDFSGYWSQKQKYIAWRHGTDPSVSSVDQLMRLPGSVHFKGTPVKSESMPMLHGPFYDWADIDEAFKPCHAPTDDERIAGTGTRGWVDVLNDIWKDNADNAHPKYISAALSLANMGQDKDLVYRAIRTEVENCFIMNGRKYEGFRDDTIKQAVESAFDKVKKEKAAKAVAEPVIPHMVGHTEFVTKYDSGKLPLFPHEEFMKWPEPWPMLLKGIADCSYDYVPAIGLMPNILWLSMFLGKDVRVKRDDKTIGHIIRVIGKSASGKDSSTTSPQNKIIQYLTDPKLALKNQLPLASETLAALDQVEDAFTSDSAYKKKIQDKEGILYRIDTESSNALKLLHSDKANTYLKQILNVEIKCYDGSKVASSDTTRFGATELIRDPFINIVRMHQLSNIAGTITQDSIEHGHAPREELVIDPGVRILKPSTEHNAAEVTPAEQLIRFLSVAPTLLSHRLVIEGGMPEREINKWERRTLMRIRVGLPVLTQEEYEKKSIAERQDEELQAEIKGDKMMDDKEWTYIRRIPEQAEKYIAVLTAFVYLWERYNDRDPSKIIPITEYGDSIRLDPEVFERFIIPWCAYQLEVKRYAYINFVDSGDFSDILETLDAVLTACKNVKVTGKTYDEFKPWLSKGAIPMKFFTKYRNNRAKLKNLDGQEYARSLSIWLMTSALEIRNIVAKKGKLIDGGMVGTPCLVPKGMKLN